MSGEPIDRDALAERARGRTVVKDVYIGEDGMVSTSQEGATEEDMTNETAVHSSRSRDMAMLLEHEEFTPTDFHVVMPDERGDPIVTVCSAVNGSALGGNDPANLPDETPHYMFAQQGEYSHILALDGRISSTPDESRELLSEWGVEVDARA